MTLKLPLSVLVVVHTKDLEVLLLERARRPGFWQSVTGSLDWLEEPLEAAAAREVREETGLLVRPERVLAVWGGADCRVTYPNGDIVEYVVTVFDCAIVAGELIGSCDETLELRWFAPEDVPALGLPCPAGLLSGAAGAALFTWNEEWLGGCAAAG